MRYAAAGDERIPRALLDPAQRIYADLVRRSAMPALLHGDLHHYNVLSDRARGWCAIDPKGVVGELEYELGAALRNPIDRPGLVREARRRRAPPRAISASRSGSTSAVRAAGASRRPCCRRSGASRTATQPRLDAALQLARVLLDSSALRGDFLD